LGEVYIATKNISHGISFTPRDIAPPGYPKHASKKAMSWFRASGIQPISWPARGPDISSMEHLWHNMKTQIVSYPTPAKGDPDLWVGVIEGWAKISVDFCQRLIPSILNIEAGPGTSRGCPNNWPQDHEQEVRKAPRCARGRTD
jgi:hypothetical protein